MGAYSLDDASLFRAIEAAASADLPRPVRAPWLSGTSTASISRLLWTRLLPGSAVVLASFTLPGLSLGADFLAEGQPGGAAQNEPAVLAPAPARRAAPVQADSIRPRLRFVIPPDTAAVPVTRAKPSAGKTQRITPQAVPVRPVEVQALAPEASAVAAPPAAMAAAPAIVATPAVPAPVSSPVSMPVPAALAAALAPLPQAKLQPSATAAGRADALRIDIKSQLLTRIDGKSAGTIDFRQTEAGLQVRLGSIADLLGDRYDAAQLARIKASSASNVYLSLADLQAQGIPISYDPVYDEFNVGTIDARPKARMKVHMDQISAPERGLGSTAMEQVRR